MADKKLFVRVAPKKDESFYRAGMRFTKDWRVVDVDDATSAALYAEQMLEVSDVQPADFVSTDPEPVEEWVDPAQSAHSELVEGQSGSTNSPRTDDSLPPTDDGLPPVDDSTVRSELVEGQSSSAKTPPKGKK